MQNQVSNTQALAQAQAAPPSYQSVIRASRAHSTSEMIWDLLRVPAAVLIFLLITYSLGEWTAMREGRLNLSTSIQAAMAALQDFDGYMTLVYPFTLFCFVELIVFISLWLLLAYDPVHGFPLLGFHACIYLPTPFSRRCSRVYPDRTQCVLSWYMRVAMCIAVSYELVHLTLTVGWEIIVAGHLLRKIAATSAAVSDRVEELFTSALITLVASLLGVAGAVAFLLYT